MVYKKLQLRCYSMKRAGLLQELTYLFKETAQEIPVSKLLSNFFFIGLYKRGYVTEPAETQYFLRVLENTELTQGYLHK